MTKSAQPLKVRQISESAFTVQGHGVHTAFMETVAALSQRSDVTVSVNQRGRFDITHIQTVGLYSVAYLLFGRGKKVVTAHVVPDSFIGSLVGAKFWRPLARLYLGWFYRRADKVLAVSGTVAEVLAGELKVPSGRIEVVYNSIDMSAYAAAPEQRDQARQGLAVPKEKFIVLGNGQVQPRKRIDVFVQMARDLPDVEFIWVGGIPFKHLGADYSNMRELMDNLPSNMTITGVIPHEDVKGYLLAANVFCLPAEQENHPMCLLEAAGASLPIVARDISEYDDTFGSDIFRCQSAEEFTSAVVELQSDQVAYKAYVKKSQIIAKRFDSATAADQVVAIYRDLL